MLTAKQVRRLRYLLNDEWVVDRGRADDDARTQKAFAKALSAIETSLELHHFAHYFNLDCGPSDLYAILQHPLCDQGTALMLFWRGAPGYYYQYASPESVPSFERDTYDFLKHIERLFLANAFSHRALAFDPGSWQGLNFLQDYRREGGLARIPQEMQKPTPGSPPAIEKL